MESVLKFVLGKLNFLLEKNRWVFVLLAVLLLVGSIVYRVQNNRIDDLKDKYSEEVKLKNALTDSVHVYINKEGDWVAEKLTIQASLKELEKSNAHLTDEQKKLVNMINEVNKSKSVIAAALVEANFVIDSLTHNGEVIVDTTKCTVEFLEQSDSSIRYSFVAMGVLPAFDNIKPTLLIKNLTLPNEVFVEFHWEDKEKKIGYPISFSVTNSNEYVKVYNINSYIIPDVKKEVLNPNGWEKIDIWMKENGKLLKFLGTGVVIGAGGTYILTR